jgi:Na+:H+ antiporter, NhaA family
VSVDRDTRPTPARPGPALRISMPRPYRSPRLRQFLADESGGAVLLLAATVLALLWANLPGDHYEAFWRAEVFVRVGSWSHTMDLRHVVNDGAMVAFFLAVGLEISRQVTVGELRDRRLVVAPALGAVGGLTLPALLYLMIARGGPGAAGWGIPISTDTAFLIGILALFGPRCPDQLRLFLLTLAIVDDLGATTVVAVFYTPHISVPALVVAAVLTLLLALLRWIGVWQLTPYVLTGLALWLAVYASGVHPTLAGVLAGVLLPTAPVEPEQGERLRFYGRAVIERADAVRVRLAMAAARATVPANERLQDVLHPVSAFLVVPLFGLANAGVRLDGSALATAVRSDVTIGIVVGLLVGNGIGITVGAGVALTAGIGLLPGRVRYGHLLGGAVLAGIGFTISLFITDLAFQDEALRQDAKIGVLAGSLLAAALGSFLLRYLGDHLPLCSLDDAVEPPALPAGPWRDPDLP